MAMLLVLAACGKAGEANEQAATTPAPSEASATPASSPTPHAEISGVPADSGGGFAPLGSQAVKDAIHRALSTGTTQRWEDAGLSGYAVPSQTPDAHGCRAVRYTIDQQPARDFPVITACDAG